MASNTDRPKPSVQLLLVNGERTDEILVGDSGEVEMSFVTAARARDEHHEVDDPRELDRLLEQIVRWVEVQ